MAQRVCDALNSRNYSEIEGLYTYLFEQNVKHLPHPTPVHALGIWALSDAIAPDLSQSEITFASNLLKKLAYPWIVWIERRKLERRPPAKQDPPEEPSVMLSVKPKPLVVPDNTINVVVCDDPEVCFEVARQQIVAKYKEIQDYTMQNVIYKSQVNIYEHTYRYMQLRDKYQGYLRLCRNHEQDRHDIETFDSEKVLLNTLNDEFEANIILMRQYALYILVKEKNEIIKADPQDRSGHLKRFVEQNNVICKAHNDQMREYKATRITMNGLKVDEIVLVPSIQRGSVEIFHSKHTAWVETYDGGGSGMGAPIGHNERVYAGSRISVLLPTVLNLYEDLKCTFAVQGDTITCINVKSDEKGFSHATIIRPIVFKFTRCT